MATKNKKVETPEVEKLVFNTKEEAKWESINFRTGLWQYFIEVKNGKPLTDKDITLVKQTYVQIKEAKESFFADVEIEGEARKSKAASLLDEVGDEVSSLLGAKSLSELKRVWTMILDGRYESLNRKQKKYLNDIKDKRKGELLK